VATFTITHTQILDNVATVQTLTSNTVEVGQEFTISGNATFNGTYVCTARPEYLFIGVDEYGDYLYDYNEIILKPSPVCQNSCKPRTCSINRHAHTYHRLHMDNQLRCRGLARVYRHEPIKRLRFIDHCDWGS
jgi:hypothetical protein